MMFRNQVDRDKTHVAREVEVVENTTIMMGHHDMKDLGRVVAALIVMLNAALITKTAIVVVVIRVGVTEVKETIDADQAEEVIITAGKVAGVSTQTVEATATRITATMMTITHLDECRGNHLLQMMRVRIGSSD